MQVHTYGSLPIVSSPPSPLLFAQMLTFYLSPLDMDSFVLVIVKRKSASKMQKELNDIVSVVSRCDRHRNNYTGISFISCTSTKNTLYSPNFI